MKKRAALPYCVSTELWLEKKSFVSAQEKEGRRFLSLAPVKRPLRSVRNRCFLQARWLKLHLSHDPLLHLQPLACEQPAEDRGASTFGLQPESTLRCETLAEADSGAVPESKGGTNGGVRHCPTLQLGKIMGDIILK